MSVFDRFNYDRLKLTITTKEVIYSDFKGFMHMIEQNDYENTLFIFY